MIEKFVSLVCFSFSENPTQAIASKIRYFYDLYYLINDIECTAYIQSHNFKTDFAELLAHDQQAFNKPAGWQTKKITDSSLITDFPALWENLRATYQNELSALAFSTIPDEKKIAQSFQKLIFKEI